MGLTTLFTVLKAGMVAANGMLNKSSKILNHPKQMVPSLMEASARLFLVRFLQDHIATGTLILLEDGGTVFTFEGTRKKNPLRVCCCHAITLIHIVTKADLGLGEAYVNGDFSFTDNTEGLYNLIMVNLWFLAEIQVATLHASLLKGWWTPLFSTAILASAKYFYHHVSRQNSLAQARRNSEDEDLKVAQLRKISSLIEKARVDKNHEVLDIGCGEAIEHVGHEYYEEFFASCESLLSEDGVFVLQFAYSFPGRKYDEIRRTPGFVREYIFPGGCLPSLSRLTSAMAASSRLWSCGTCGKDRNTLCQDTQMLEANLLRNQSKILTLGFDQEFIRTFEYYFDSTAAGFKTETLGDYQVVFSRPGNVATIEDPYKGTVISDL
ncbi:cyclopropane-fatty-acyl-phospholipid synthase [Tanacetum coccineum]